MTAYEFGELFDGIIKKEEEVPKVDNVIVETYIIQITRYPNGEIYQKIFPPKRTIKSGNKKKKVKKPLQKVLVQEEEVY